MYPVYYATNTNNGYEDMGYEYTKIGMYLHYQLISNDIIS